MLAQVQKAVQKGLTIFENPYVFAVFTLFAGCYASIIAPRVTSGVRELFDSTLFKLAFFFVVVMLAHKDPRLALIMSLLFVFSMQHLAKYNVAAKLAAPVMAAAPVAQVATPAPVAPVAPVAQKDAADMLYDVPRGEDPVYGPAPVAAEVKALALPPLATDVEAVDPMGMAAEGPAPAQFETAAPVGAVHPEYVQNGVQAGAVPAELPGYEREEGAAF